MVELLVKSERRGVAGKDPSPSHRRILAKQNDRQLNTSIISQLIDMGLFVSTTNQLYKKHPLN